MVTKKYFDAIDFIQDTLLGLSLALLVILPVTLSYVPEFIPGSFMTFLYEISLFAVFLVMSVRPLADVFPQVSWLRPLVILRKGFGVFSASIIVSFMLSKFMVDGWSYFATFFSASHWTLHGFKILAPLGDISALILLITSNKYSKRILKKNWKRVQKLAYVYFYAGALYEYLVLDQQFALSFAFIALALSVLAFVMKRLVLVTMQPV
jgi:DMSO/TMAO reductase YedYZ heme-binding membrane subunit